MVHSTGNHQVVRIDTNYIVFGSINFRSDGPLGWGKNISRKILEYLYGRSGLLNLSFGFRVPEPVI